MTRITFLILCSLACFSQVTSNQLTKETDAELQTFYNSLEYSDLHEQFVSLFFHSTPEAIENVNALLARSAVLNVPRIIDSFNTGIKYNLLVVSEGFVKVDPAVLEKALLTLARDVTKMLFPKDKFQQLLAYTVIQKQIKDTTKRLPPLIDRSKIPVGVLSAAISEPAYKVAKVQPKAGFLVDLQYQVCNSTVSYVSSLVGTAINNAAKLLSSISVAGSSNVVIANLLEFLISLAGQALSLLDNLSDSVGSLLCNTLLSASRRRRDVEVVGRSISESVDSRDISSVTSNLLTVIWTSISSVLKQFLVTGANSVFALLQTYVADVIATLLASAIALIDQYL